ncbi:MAG: STAS domain-containing protein [Paucibacter sp.]|nr:STAS domain-containing protein [Roseateles sp.]
MSSTPSMLKLPASVGLSEAGALWPGLQQSLRAECAQLRSAAARELNLSLADLQHFDSAVLTLLISAARLCQAEGLKLRLHEVPAKLQELARVYGVAELLWPELVPAAAA